MSLSLSLSLLLRNVLLVRLCEISLTRISSGSDRTGEASALSWPSPSPEQPGKNGDGHNKEIREQKRLPQEKQHVSTIQKLFCFKFALESNPSICEQNSWTGVPRTLANLQLLISKFYQSRRRKNQKYKKKENASTKHRAQQIKKLLTTTDSLVVLPLHDYINIKTKSPTTKTQNKQQINAS